MDVVVFAGCAMAVLVAWCVVALRITGRMPGVRRRPAPPTPPAPQDQPAPVIDLRLSVEWASPRQVWPALTAENTLLAARLAGRLTPGEYRARMLELARRCEPRPTAGSE
ncbi:hypothetical protein [Nocardia macrotermitis]|uniref:hypothetical protein n=1 Tax=Nocardia macrotermitis TaxID=2585198 RepID=UPI0012954D7B|nr:hypothetical protein [Nocardia macrotermitis]